eukprot:Sdes_comp10133_c0_seq1m1746
MYSFRNSHVQVVFCLCSNSEITEHVQISEENAIEQISPENFSYFTSICKGLVNVICFFPSQIFCALGLRKTVTYKRKKTSRKSIVRWIGSKFPAKPPNNIYQEVIIEDLLKDSLYPLRSHVNSLNSSPCVPSQNSRKFSLS